MRIHPLAGPSETYLPGSGGGELCRGLPPTRSGRRKAQGQGWGCERCQGQARVGVAARRRNVTVEARVGKDGSVFLRVGEFEHRLLEAGLGEGLTRRAEAILVPAAVRRRLLPPRRDDGASLPHRSAWPRRQHAGAEVALLGEARGVKRAGVEDFHRAATRHAARVGNRRMAGRAPRIKLEDVLVRAGRRVVVRRPVLLVEVGGRRLRRSRAVVTNEG